MGRANYHSLFTYKASFSSLPISFPNLRELGVCYFGVFFLHRKQQTEKPQSHTSRFPQPKWEHLTPGSAPSAAVETPGLVLGAVMVPSRSWHSDSQNLPLLTLCAGGKSTSGAKRGTDPWVWPCRALSINHKQFRVDRGSSAPEMPERPGWLQGRWGRSPRCVWHSASFTAWTAGTIQGHPRLLWEMPALGTAAGWQRAASHCSCTQSPATLHPPSLPKLLMLKDIFHSCPKHSHL